MSLRMPSHPVSILGSREPVASPGHFDQYRNPACLASSLGFWGAIGQSWLDGDLSGTAGCLASSGQLWPDDG